MIQAQKPFGDELFELLRASNETAKAFKQPPLYTGQTPSMMTDDSRKLGGSEPTSKKAWEKSSSTDKPSLNANEINKELDMSSKFHISLGWMLEAPSQDLISKLNSVMEEQAMGFQIPVDTVKVKIGNGITAVPLTSNVQASGGFIDM